jgi:hypothetical protein
MQSEDGLSFLSAVVGAFGSTFTQQPGGPNVLLVGLLLAAVSKALPSLADKSMTGKDKIEDVALFGAAVLSFLAAGIQSSWTFSNPSIWVYILLLLGVLLKTGIDLPKGKPEDVAAFIVALAAILLVPLIPRSASVGLFFSFLAKTLTSSSSTT